ncbi:LRR receptor-like serine/threonine-protein kinase RGI5 [Telopea speciosissima]|uniref:LRR receptor-like serine/threonine-protein kinase RGI5 n=1 Tax=Telopea speciosissima TaxID=54955 RepID=UPI001CC4E90B|nr:LRR receptor-like serine/threonine-protein kinase RGI5 [Telopea speciosissima]
MGSLYISVSTLFLMIFTASELLFRGDSKTYWGDVKGLKELKKGLDNGSVTPGSCLSSWVFSVDPCDYVFSDRFTCGFRCDLVVSGMNRVTGVSLDQAGYTGSLSSSACNYLPYLEILDLAYNSLSGSIPTSLSNLTRLRRLSLSGNSFSGEIPTSIGSLSALEELYLDWNQLQGSIPASFKGLASLKRLELQGNRISGELPDLGSLKNLSFLDASDNAISGGAPVGLPGSLVEIVMRNNSLEGNLSEKIKIRDLGFLQVMDLSHNRLSGAVPSIVFQHPSLQQLTLTHNRLSSIQVPRDRGARSELVALDLSYNELQGLLPAFMGIMPKLSALSMEKNKFTGMIPSQYALKAAVPSEGTSPFARLLLGGNYLFGPIPGPLMALKPGSANVSLVDNCLFKCPETFFFCEGGVQKSSMDCKSFEPVIPRY